MITSAQERKRLSLTGGGYINLLGGLQGVLKNPKTGVHQLAGAVFPKT
jgi:hypothetical protein